MAKRVRNSIFSTGLPDRARRQVNNVYEVTSSSVLVNYSCRSIRGSIIYNDPLLRKDSLRQYRLDGVSDEALFIAYWHDNRVPHAR